MDLDFLRKTDIEEQTAEDLTATLAAKTFPPDGLNLFKYARWLIYVLVFSTPLFLLPWTSEVLELNKQLLIFVLSSIGLILYLVQTIRTGRLVIRKSFLNYAVLVFLAAVLLVSLFSDFKYQSLFGGFGAGFYESFVSTAGLAIFFFLVVNIFGFSGDSTKEDARKLLNIFGLSLFAVLILGVLQILGIPVFKTFGISAKFFNTVGTFNSFGIMAAALLTLCSSKAVFQKGFLSYFRLPALFLAFFTLLILNWWVIWLIAISGLIFVLISNSISDWRMSNYFWPAALVILAAIFLFFNFNLAGLLGIKPPVEVSPSFRASFEIAKKVLASDPLFGVGPENFQLAYDFHRPQLINNTIFWNVKFSESASEAFNSAISLGLVGFAAFLLLISAGFKEGVKNHKLLPIFAVLVSAWVLYPFNLTIGFSFWLLLGVIALAASKSSDELEINLEKSPRFSVFASVSFVGILLLVLTSFYFMGLRYAANIQFVKALSESDIEKQTRLLTSAVNLNRNEDMHLRETANFIVARVNQGMANFRNIKNEADRESAVSRIQNFSAAAINLMEDLTRRHGRDSRNWLVRALVFENLINIVDGSDKWAVKMYEEYLKLSPKDPEPYLRIGNINFAGADFLRQLNRADLRNQVSTGLKLAEENYLKAIELKPNYILAIYNLGVVYERQGRVKEAIGQLELIKQANPSDANLAFQLGLLYYRDNQKTKSFNELGRATSIFPDFSNARWYLALLYEERGELDSALGQLYKVEKLNPDNATLMAKIDQLEAGKRLIPPQKVTGVKPLEEKSRNQ
ncbi:MAG: tetratricopeptide repeat protein [Patescibacteria group bacterium]